MKNRSVPSQFVARDLLAYVPWAIGVVICLALFNGALNYKDNSLDELLSKCNLRLLDSVRSWSEVGFWNLGGLMSFRSSLTPLPAPTHLYSSQSTLYIVPHFIAYLWGGTAAFWPIVRSSAYVSAAVMSLSVAIFAWLLSEEWIKTVRSPRFLLGLALFASFAITFPNEGIWGGLWNSDDRGLSSALLALASAFLALSVRLNQVYWHRFSAVLLISAAIGCPRMGVMLAITVLIGRYGLDRKCLSVAAVFSWPMALALFGSSALHYIRVGLVDLTGKYILGGSSLLDRFGFIHKMRTNGQSDLDYESITQAFGFAWRQSELMIGSIPLISSVEHLLVYVFSAGGLILLFKRMYHSQSRYLAPLSLVTAPPLLWGILINQSVSEHPDIHAITWVLPFVLGLFYLLEWLVSFVSKQFGVFWSIMAGSWMAYWLFLWQVQYFLRFYPALRAPYPL